MAVPVAPPDILAELACEADWVVCLNQPAHFHALSQHYLGFPQLSDGDVVSAMDKAARSQSARQRGKQKQIIVTKKQRRETGAEK